MSVILTEIKMLEEMNSDVTHAHINFCDDADHVIDYDILGIKSFKSVDGLIDEIKKMKKNSGVTGQEVWNECLYYVIETIKEYCEVEE